MKLDNYNIIYQNGGMNWKKLFICGSSQKEKIACKKQENDIKSALEPVLEPSLDDISISSIDTEELMKELEEKKPLSNEEQNRQLKELEQQVENNMSEVSNDLFVLKMTADEEKELEDDFNKLGGGINFLKFFICGSSQKEKIACKKQENDIKFALGNLINSYVEIKKLKIIEINKGQRIKQLIKEALALNEQLENAKLTTERNQKKKLINFKLTLKRKETNVLKNLSKNIVMIETKNKNIIREIIKRNATGLSQKQFDFKFNTLLSKIIELSQKKFQKENTSLGGKTKKTKKTKKVRKHRGIHQTGGKAGKLQKGYKYSGKRLKNGKAEIKKVKSKK